MTLSSIYMPGIFLVIKSPSFNNRWWPCWGETNAFNCLWYYSFYCLCEDFCHQLLDLCAHEFLICLIFLLSGWETSVVLKCRSMQWLGALIFPVPLNAKDYAHLFVNSTNMYWVSTKCCWYVMIQTETVPTTYMKFIGQWGR